jgi:hypothetical protein
MSLLASAVLIGPRRTKGSQGQPPQDAQQIVNQFFPVSLAVAPEATPGSWVSRKRDSAFVIFEQLPDGRPATILAAYTNGIGGAIRLIRAQPDGSYSVVFEPSGLDLGGFTVSCLLLDVDGDSRPEGIVSFASYRAQTSEWVFRWNGPALENLTPMRQDESGLQATLLMLAKFVDLDHDGKLEIISEENYPPRETESGAALGGSVVYKLDGNQYTVDRPILYWGTFVRRTGQPQTETYEFSLLEDSSGPYTLKLTNGDANGGKRVSSARIVVNGAEVLSPNNLSQQVEFLTLPVSLVQKNTIQVTLAGTPLGHVFITIQDQAAVQRAQQGGPQP